MNYPVSLLLEGDAARRKLARLFQSEALGRAPRRSTVNIAPDGVLVLRADGEPLRALGCERAIVPGCRLAAPRTRQPDQLKRDLTVSCFIFTLVFLGAALAAYTDRPLFWLLIGPTPVAVLHTIIALLR